MLASVREIPQSLHRIFLLSSPNFFHRSTNCGRAAGAPEKALLQLLRSTSKESARSVQFKGPSTLVQRDFDQVVPLDIGLSPLGRMFKQFPT